MKKQRGFIHWTTLDSVVFVGIIGAIGYGTIRGIEWLLSKITLSVGWL